MGLVRLYRARLGDEFEFKFMILGFTGHRPSGLPGRYSSRTYNALLDTATYVLHQYRPVAVISGFALGWDIAVAEASLNLNIPLIAAVPFRGQENRWSTLNQMQYRYFLSRASQVHITCDGGYTTQAMQLRNQWIVDRCNVLMGLCNGTSGGTVNCINYALAQNRQSFNCWNTFLYFYDQNHSNYKGF